MTSPHFPTNGIRIEKATMPDAPHIHEVVTFFADRDEMLHRPLNSTFR